MSERTLKRMLAVLAVLVVAWGLVLAGGRGGSSASAQGGGAMGAFLGAVDTEAVQAVRIEGRGPGGALRVERAPGTPTGWTVDGHPADADRVHRFMEALAGASTGAPVSINPANRARMGVDDTSAARLVLEGGGRSDTLLLGKEGPAYATVYARLPGQNEVYLLQSNLGVYPARDEGDWRSKAMAAVDTGRVSAVEVARDGETYRLARSDGSWTVDGRAADSAAVRGVLDELASLRAGGFPDSATAAAGAAGAQRRVTVLGPGGATLLTVRLWSEGTKDGGSLLAVADGPAARQAGTPFTYPSFRADRLAPDKSGTLPVRR